MKTRQASKARGFAMLVVVMIVALVSVIALTLLNFLQIDLSIVGQNSRATEARFLADAGNMEIVDHTTTEALLPLVHNDPGLTLPVPAVPGSWVNRPLGSETARPETYTGQARFLRQVIVEDNTFVVRGLVYEIAATGVINNGDASSEVRSEIMRLTTIDSSGGPQVRQHAR